MTERVIKFAGRHERLKTELVVQGLIMAVLARRPPKGLIFPASGISLRPMNGKGLWTRHEDASRSKRSNVARGGTWLQEPANIQIPP
jgi:hypothetical protein